MQGGGSNGGKEREKSCQTMAAEIAMDSRGRLRSLETMSGWEYSQNHFGKSRGTAEIKPRVAATKIRQEAEKWAGGGHLEGLGQCVLLARRPQHTPPKPSAMSWSSGPSSLFSD